MYWLRGRGLPRLGDGLRGDLYIPLGVYVPGRLTDRQKQLFEQLRLRERRSSTR